MVEQRSIKPRLSPVVRSDEHVGVCDGVYKTLLAKEFLPRRRLVVSRYQNFQPAVLKDSDHAVVVEITRRSLGRYKTLY